MRQISNIQVGNYPRTDRIPRPDMSLDKEHQHFATALIQNVRTLSHLSQSSSEIGGNQAEPKERQHFATALIQNVRTLSHLSQSCSEMGGKQAEPKMR